MKEMEYTYNILSRIKQELNAFSVEIRLAEFEDEQGIHTCYDIIIYSEDVGYPIEININTDEEYLSEFNLDKTIEHLKMEIETLMRSGGVDFYSYSDNKYLH